jgi:hypothetical protein
VFLVTSEIGVFGIADAAAVFMGTWGTPSATKPTNAVHALLLVLFSPVQHVAKSLLGRASSIVVKHKEI